MVTHSMENILNMHHQYYHDEAPQSPPSRKRSRCLNKEQDPMSHRIIEKRRRDRMNNCLADLSRLIPAEYLKKGRGRVEKTEIIEMAIRHMKHLQGIHQDTKQSQQVHQHTDDSIDSVPHSPPTTSSISSEHYRLGFQECLSETTQFLVDVEGFYARDSLCLQLMNHLRQHCEKILATNDRLGFSHPELSTTNISNVTNYNHTSIQNICQPTTQSDHGSSSGVSSFDDPERSRTIIQPPTIISDDSNHSLPSNSPKLLSSSSSSSSSINNITRPTNYKFKSSIKQRFTAERIKSSPSPVSEKQHGIPIFALHDAGSFYIPLTIESSLLRPHLDFISDTNNDTVLHPVTISVNFNQTPSNIWSQQHHNTNGHDHI
ncbi:transcription factor cwo isoform X2 [Aphidius gifuensis]|uniref:transcription factor cwo isoform X2 n=1 Tax=Aphidius gifuensis TaxID=684658 RepID=UPI001CDCBA3F|nr:transcription factor cwo isoform X2 [Aphidius gifuensis]